LIILCFYFGRFLLTAHRASVYAGSRAYQSAGG